MISRYQKLLSSGCRLLTIAAATSVTLTAHAACDVVSSGNEECTVDGYEVVSMFANASGQGARARPEFDGMRQIHLYTDKSGTLAHFATIEQYPKRVTGVKPEETINQIDHYRVSRRVFGMMYRMLQDLDTVVFELKSATGGSTEFGRIRLRSGVQRL